MKKSGNCTGCNQPNPVNHPVMPSRGRLVWNFMRSLKRLLVNGSRYVSEEELNRRLFVCETCDLRVGNRCSHPDCGCYLDMVPIDIPGIGGAPGRAQYLSLDCPAGKWAKEPFTQTAPRHLLYHVMPVRDKIAWRWNIEQLKHRIELFDGKRIVAIVVDGNCDPADAVIESLAGVRIDEFLVFQNEPKLREVKTWEPLWERVVNEPGVTFYGHAKGVTKSLDHPTVRRWTQLLYEACLDYWPLVEDQLREFPITGALKKVGAKAFPGSESQWHYTGTFFWIRNEAMRPIYKQIDREWFGNEAHAGLHFKPHDAGVLVEVGSVSDLNMYQPEIMDSVEKNFQTWKLRHQQNRSVIG